ncbi:uncharacterized protein LOC132706315 [Cylas formicarius]|uniref:uncharacterized protein LOC132706315 n=1 Tax=Cylas formicarius TaxID=197179 RepID=UPI002958B682|nr:uncharacterized protein LOC132706315 [Cylas formicarius]
MSVGLTISGLLFVFCVGNGHPSGYGYYPKRAVMFGGYYSNPMPAYEYVPQGQMTAMVAGDTVATNSFSGQPWSTPGKPLHVAAEEEAAGSPFNQPIEQITEKAPKPSLVDESLNEADVEYEPDEQESSSSEEPVTDAALIVTTKSTKTLPSKKPTQQRRPKKPVKQEEDEGDDDDGLSSGWPFGSRRGGIPAYNAFFPIFIGGGSSRSRTRSGDLEDGGYYPGSATAIANSFSTGKGGVATSHATSFGDPYAAAVMRNSGLFNFRTKGKNSPAQQQD